MGVLNAKVGTEWVPISAGQSNVDHWNSAWGIVATGAFKSGLVNPVSVTTADQIITDPLVVTMISGRRYRIVCQLRAVVGTSAAVALRLAAYDGGVSKANEWGDVYCNAVTTSLAYDNIETGFIVEGDGASHSVTIMATANGPSGVIQAHFNQNCRFFVQDIGPVTRLAAGATPPASDWTAYDARYAPINAPFTQVWANPFSGGIVLGNGTVSGYYVKQGRLVHAHCQFLLGSTSDVTGNIYVTLPVTPWSGVMGEVVFLDNSSTWHPGMVVPSGTGQVVLLAVHTAGAVAAASSPTSTSPMDWAVNDMVVYQVTYIAAA